MIIIEKVGRVARVEFGRDVARQRSERGRGPFPDAAVMTFSENLARGGVDLGRLGAVGRYEEETKVKPSLFRS
jgi:hypothetical protein